jgi:hypothetical protein
MKKHQKLTQDQLNEVGELAKTKRWKEIASHFNMNKDTFLFIRKQQPEIDVIYYKNTKGKQNKLYTPEEILEIGKMAKTLNLETIAKNLGTTIPYLKRARANQPDLDKALIKSIEGWVSKKVQEKIKPLNPESRMLEDISPEEAIIRFRELKAEEKRKRLIQELKEIDL